MSRTRVALTAVLLAVSTAPIGLAQDGIRNVAGKEAEVLPDGSTGRVVEYRAADGSYIPAYLRRPKGPGPFPIVVMLHGGAPDPGITYKLGQTSNPPAADFIAAGWALLVIDYHPNPTQPTSDRADAIAAIQQAKRLPFVDPARVALFGGSHGGNVISRIVSQANVRCAVMCAPALLDLYEISKVIDQGLEVAGVLKNMVAGAPKRYGAPLAEVVKDPAKYKYESSLLEAAQVRCPVLIVNGRNDTSAPIAVSQAYVDRLRAAGKQVETYFPDDGRHGFYFGFMDNRNSGKPPDVRPETREAARRAVDFIRRNFASAAPAPIRQAGKYGYGTPDALQWVDPDHSDAGDLQFKVFHSTTIHADVSYMIYLPPDYERNPNTRYPVLYQLPASGGTPRRDGPQVTLRIDHAIRAQRIGPMIVVAVNGLAGNTMYCDTCDGQYPLETVIVKDLIPHIDATYRTIASRDGRGVNGFSMGGFGAAHLGFKYPDLFGVVSIMAPPLIEPGMTGLPAQAWSRLFPSAMDSDMAYWKANNPFELAARNAAKLRDRTYIRIVAHSENEHWLAPQCEKLHRILADNMVQHEYAFLVNVKSHNPIQCMDSLGDAAFSFFSSSIPATADASWERLPDGTLGRQTGFQGVDGVKIAAYVRKPAGAGPFPAIIWMHGGGDSQLVTVNMGRSQQSPIEDLAREGWVIYSADYRHAEKIGIYPVEFDDTVRAVEAARALPFVDPKRVGYMGQSHGAQVGTRVVCRVDLSGAVIMAPAAMDFIEIKKAIRGGVKLVPVLSTMLAGLEQQYGAPMEEIAKDPVRYGYTSGITEAPRARCPILVENARDDDNSPPSVVAAWVKALRAAGKQVETYEPEQGGHAFYFGRPLIPATGEAASRAVVFFQKVFTETK